MLQPLLARSQSTLFSVLTIESPRRPSGHLIVAELVNAGGTVVACSWVNEELRQDSNTSDMVFSVGQLVSYISQYFPLDPGDVIFSGTPEGVAMGMQPPVWLKPGDEVIVEVEQLGRLNNVMAAEDNQ